MRVSSSSQHESGGVEVPRYRLYRNGLKVPRYPVVNSTSCVCHTFAPQLVQQLAQLVKALDAMAAPMFVMVQPIDLADGVS